MKTSMKPFVLKLTKDELTILQYVIPGDSYGDPLKDTYELGDDEPEDPYGALSTLHTKVQRLNWKQARSAVKKDKP